MSDLKEFPIDQMHKEVESIYHILNESLKPIQDPKIPNSEARVVGIKDLHKLSDEEAREVLYDPRVMKQMMPPVMVLPG